MDICKIAYPNGVVGKLNLGDSTSQYVGGLGIARRIKETLSG